MFVFLSFERINKLKKKNQIFRVKRSTFRKLLKLLSAKMPVIWKPMTQSIGCTWNNLLAKANVLADLKQESW